MLRLKHKTGTVETKLLYRELSLVEMPSTARSMGTTLRGRSYDHLLHTRRVWSIRVATEMSVNDVHALRAFWSAEERWIQMPFDNDDTANWVRVSTADGACPITYIDGLVDFPEAALELTEML